MYINLVSLFQIGMKQYLEYKPINSNIKRTRTHFQISDCHAMRFFSSYTFSENFKFLKVKNKELRSYFNVVNKRNCNILPQKILDQI